MSTCQPLLRSTCGREVALSIRSAGWALERGGASVLSSRGPERQQSQLRARKQAHAPPTGSQSAVHVEWNAPDSVESTVEDGVGVTQSETREERQVNLCAVAVPR